MSHCSPLTILLIDGCPENRMAYSRFLMEDSLYTYRILEFETATEAMKWCQQEIPDVIVLDFWSPDWDGWMFLQKCKEHLSSAQFNVIILT
ncbi:MAG: response regulator, partial [Scytonema sp. PMC 1069.18]|nr:response regulator [Scytonema sp. PMC 1069.18]